MYISEKEIESRREHLSSEIDELSNDIDLLNLEYSIEFDSNVESLIIISTNKLYELYSEYEEEFGQYWDLY